MTKVCYNSSSAIYDNGDSWVWKINGQEDQVYPKSEMPLLPLSAVVKYDMCTHDQSILGKLRESAFQALQQDFNLREK